jgi:hypothetical protein
VFSADLSRPATAEDIGARTPATEAGSSADGEASPNVEASTETVLVPEQLELKADRQFYDSKRKITIAEGNVTARLGEPNSKPIESNSTLPFAHFLHAVPFDCTAETSFFKPLSCVTTSFKTRVSSMMSMA